MTIIKAKKLEIRGLIQGVGFRPFIYRIANNNKITGTVENNNKGVTIYIEGNSDSISNFEKELIAELPEAAIINEIIKSDIAPPGYPDFRIIKSTSASDEVTQVSPDIAVCMNCLEDMQKQPHRLNYPFTNCTNCGPRFTIISDLPYDRDKTTMGEFIMCRECQHEYTDILNRRFHAQPVACNNCGPVYTLHENGLRITQINEIIERVCHLIENDKIISLKGLGGYNIACNPFYEQVVKELRNKKNREGKPFALMFKDSETISNFLQINPEERAALENWKRPIVLLKMKDDNLFAPSVSIGLNSVGAMLPYLPFHHLLMKNIKLPAIILTSGNLSDEPILIDDQQALLQLGPISEGVITNNRKIFNRTDDSVTFVANGKERIIRRSRGFVPSPIILKLETEGIFAAGAELVNCFCIGKMNQAILSQHIGDLKNLETFEFYQESVERFKQLFRFRPILAVTDMHPEYLSTKYAERLNVPFLQVQHHHAHIVSCMAENNIDEPVIGVSFDGTGYGDDGNIWGGEFLICDLEEYKRFTHFEYIRQPGGDSANKHPWRMMLAYLYHYFGENCVRDFSFLFETLDSEQVEFVLNQIQKNINCPLTSSAGRLFDAVSALLGIVHHSSYHAEAPMRLESLASCEENGSYQFEIHQHISFKKTIVEMITDIQNGIETKVISSKFHQTVVEVIARTVSMISKESKIRKVILSGGTFQNKIILEKTEKLLKAKGFDVFSHKAVPSNDGGIALGQLVIAAKRRSSGKL